MYRLRRASNKEIVVIAIILLTIMYLISSIRPLAIITNAWTLTESSRYDFSIEHPAKWVDREYGEKGWRNQENVIFILSSDVDHGFNNIWIQRKVASNPIVDDVAIWGNTYLEEVGRSLTQIELQEKVINGQRVITRKYTLGSLTNLDVYIARKNDMIIITLRTTEGQFDNYISDFMRIVNSFSSIP